jgi:hypothetical protein
LVDVNITDKGRRTGAQPPHGPWGGKEGDALSNKAAYNVFPPKKDIKARPKTAPKNPD